MGITSISLVELVLRGIPEAFLVLLALHIFTGTPINKKKYIVLSLLQCSIAFGIRFLPVAVGANSILSLIIVVLLFQFAYGGQINTIIKTIIAETLTLVLLAVSEVFNVGLLVAICGYEKTENILQQSTGVTKVLYSLPSLFFFALFIFIASIIVKKRNRKKTENEETGNLSGE